MSIALSCDGDIDPERLELWVATVTTASSMQVLHVKGVLALAGQRRRYVTSGVRALLDGHLDRPWTRRRRSHLVLIGRTSTKARCEPAFTPARARTLARTDSRDGPTDGLRRLLTRCGPTDAGLSATRLTVRSRRRREPQG
jgi:hypothetical protein